MHRSNAHLRSKGSTTWTGTCTYDNRVTIVSHTYPNTQVHPLNLLIHPSETFHNIAYMTLEKQGIKDAFP